mmetsp:Transcript_17361/g.15654  ORF Transcript_17361/g.15654 Transcript_17361/m.15654 type:complete len:179 (-) Transcript_17361:82-618(-)
MKFDSKHNYIKTNLNKRSGKWSKEEIRFASRLINDFKCGLLKDCDYGVTLRSYLSIRLNCSPMRISKKYSGLKIGKLIYSHRLNPFNNTSASRSIEDLEDLFHKSIQNNQDDDKEDINHFIKLKKSIKSLENLNMNIQSNKSNYDCHSEADEWLEVLNDLSDNDDCLSFNFDFLSDLI